MQKSILVAMALILFQGLSYSASSDEFEEDDVPSRQVHRLTLGEKKFRDQQNYQAATLRAQEAALQDKQKYQRATLLAKEEEAKIQKARLKAEAEERDLRRRELEIKERELKVKEAEQARLRAAKPHHLPAAKAKASADSAWQDDLAEAEDFLIQWAEEPVSRYDAFMKDIIGRHKRGVPLSADAVSNLLDRKDTILRALEIAKNKIRTKTYTDLAQKEKIQESIDGGIIGLTYESAQRVIQNDELDQAEKKQSQAQAKPKPLKTVRS